ncbi:hypothetical protein HN630_02075 [archaeon]|jgi:hypothetical protein|nr:hypothetical protein [archaeon]MBT6956206.1 hypothetical protein [archaeon]MBT7567666.1 hypothetical protein [archaeon]
MSFRKDRRGVVGTIISTFIATIVIVLILVIFTLGAGIVKSIGAAEGGLMLRDTIDVGIGITESYIVSFVRIVKLRGLVEAEGMKFEDAFNEAEKMEVKVK